MQVSARIDETVFQTAVTEKCLAVNICLVVILRRNSGRFALSRVTIFHISGRTYVSTVTVVYEPRVSIKFSVQLKPTSQDLRSQRQCVGRWALPKAVTVQTSEQTSLWPRRQSLPFVSALAYLCGAGRVSESLAGLFGPRVRFSVRP